MRFEEGGDDEYEYEPSDPPSYHTDADADTDVDADVEANSDTTEVASSLQLTEESLAAIIRLNSRLYDLEEMLGMLHDFEQGCGSEYCVLMHIPSSFSPRPRLVLRSC